MQTLMTAAELRLHLSGLRWLGLALLCAGNSHAHDGAWGLGWSLASFFAICLSVHAFHRASEAAR